MKYETSAAILAFLSITSALPTQNTTPLYRLRGREVPQEHSHNQIVADVRTALNQNNPAGIVDPIFGLLGDAAAAGGLGKITNADCLQQATADQAFTNAKAAKDVGLQTSALIFRALERNTGKVGLASVACTAIKAVNPEIAAISQHQDPASSGAAGINKAIVLELAKQIASVGGNPQDALKSGTFAPGNLSDDTGKGNTCDVQNDVEGCIFSQNLLVDDATAAEIAAAVGGSGTTPTTTASTPATTPADTGSECPAQTTITATVAGSEPTGTATSAASSTATASSGTNVQTFTGTLGGAAPPVIFTAGAARPFAVDGTTDINKAAALQRSCDVQKNSCANAANSGALAGGEGQCETQHTACLNAAN